MKENDTNSWKYFLLFVVLVVFVIGAWFFNIYYLKHYWSAESPCDAGEQAGLFGDQFGAVNALFSGLAFVGLIITILLQREDLKATRLEMRLQKEEFVTQNANHFLTMLKNSIIQLKEGDNKNVIGDLARNLCFSFTQVTKEIQDKFVRNEIKNDIFEQHTVYDIDDVIDESELLRFRQFRLERLLTNQQSVALQYIEKLLLMLDYVKQSYDGNNLHAHLNDFLISLSSDDYILLICYCYYTGKDINDFKNTRYWRNEYGVEQHFNKWSVFRSIIREYRSADNK